MLGLIEFRVEEGVEEGIRLIKMLIFNWIYYQFIMGKSIKMNGYKNNVNIVVLNWVYFSIIYCFLDFICVVYFWFQFIEYLLVL